MLKKLALVGIKSRLKDYLVLFSGLIVSASTFYMFMTLATNSDFLGHNSMMSASNTAFIYIFGAILLAIITLVYLVYANSFLLNMRQRDYGMFMMLGAKTSKIGQLIFAETFVLGIVATLIGTLIGAGLSRIVAQLLVQQMGLTLHYFNPFYWPAILITLSFFIVLFIFAAIWNSRKLMKTPVLKLLRDSEQPVHNHFKTSHLVVQAILGVVLLAIGYWAMANVQLLILAAIPIALVTIVLGSYFTFNATFSWIIMLLKKNKRFSLRGIRNFTLSQLNFRIHSYTRMLAMISILFALALGAITVGLGFRNDLQTILKFNQAYDLTIYEHNQTIDAKVKQLEITHQDRYDYKKDKNHIYYNLDQLKQKPLYDVQLSQKTRNLSQAKIKRYRAADYQKKDSQARQAAERELTKIDLYSGDVKKVHFLPAAEFAAVPLAKQHQTKIRVKDFVTDRKLIGKIERMQREANPKLKTAFEMSKFTNAQLMSGMYSGMIFMGFFLGISFLAMLASCLMFKILSGAYSDIRRYAMLNKMGVRPQVLRRSISRELGVLYLLPGLMGVIHVLFGLQLFKILMLNPYQGIWLPFVIFLVFYLIYYLLTVWLYRGIVLPDQEIVR